MNKMNVIYQVPEEVLKEIRLVNAEILETLKNLAGEKPRAFVTRKEFMREAKIGPTFMHELLSNGKIKFHRAGKKLIRIPYEELIRFQQGQL